MLDEELLNMIMRHIGKNKVIGNINEIPECVQGFKSQHYNCAIPSDLKCPYDIFKYFRYKKDHRKPCEKNVENENKTDNCKGNILLKQILLYIDPICVLSSNELLYKKLENFKEQLSCHLDDDKNYFRVMGFSRKKGVKIDNMKKELKSRTTDGNLSYETMLYICKVCNIDIIILNVVNEERKEIYCQNSTVSNVFILQSPDKNGNNSYILESTENTNPSKKIVDILKDKEGITDQDSESHFLTKILNMKYNDQKKLLQFIEGNDYTKKMKKQDIVNDLRKKIEEI